MTIYLYINDPIFIKQPLLLKKTTMQTEKQIAADPNRKRSFKNNVVIRRNYYCSNKCLFAAFLILLCGIYFSRSPDQPKVEPTQALNSAQPSRYDDVQVETAAEAYVRNYCNSGSGCQKKSAQALTSLLNLIAKEAEEKGNKQEVMAQRVEQQKQQLPNSLQNNHNKAQDLLSKQLVKQQAKDDNKQTILKQIPLFIIKSPLVTTPNQIGFLSTLLSFNKIDSYPNIDSIVKEDSLHTNEWKPSSKLITLSVRSNSPIHPKIVEIQSYNCKATTLDLVGIIITIDSNIQPVKIGTYPITNGLNRISCNRPQCEDGYDILMIALSNCFIHKMRVFQSYEL